MEKTKNTDQQSLKELVVHLLVDCEQEAENLSSRVQECTEVQSVEKTLVALYSKLTTVFGLCSKLAWS